MPHVPIQHYVYCRFFEGLNFCELRNNFANLLSKLRTCCTCNVAWVWHTSLVLSNIHCHAVVRSSSQLSILSQCRPLKLAAVNTVTLSSAQARSCQQSNAISLKSVPCRFGSIAPGCCPSMLLTFHVFNLFVHHTNDLSESEWC